MSTSERIALGAFGLATLGLIARGCPKIPLPANTPPPTERVDLPDDASIRDLTEHFRDIMEDSGIEDDQLPITLPLTEDGTLPENFNAIPVVVDCITADPDFLCLNGWWGSHGAHCYQSTPDSSAYMLNISQHKNNRGRTTNVRLAIGSLESFYDFSSDDPQAIEDIATTICRDAMDLLNTTQNPSTVCAHKPLALCLPGLQREGGIAPFITEGVDNLTAEIDDVFTFTLSSTNSFTVELDGATSTIHLMPISTQDGTIVEYSVVTISNTTDAGAQARFTDEVTLVDYLAGFDGSKILPQGE